MLEIKCFSIIYLQHVNRKNYIHFQKYYHSKKLHKEVSQIILDDAFSCLHFFSCNLAKNLGSMFLNSFVVISFCIWVLIHYYYPFRCRIWSPTKTIMQKVVKYAPSDYTFQMLRSKTLHLRQSCKSCKET